MKRLVVLVATLGIMASIVIAQSARSVNAVGYNTLNLGPGASDMVSFPWIPMGGTNLSDIIGNQLPVGSRVWKWTGLGYDMATFQSGRAGLAWVPNLAIDRGDSFWLRNAGTGTVAVTFTGEVPTPRNFAGTTTVTIASAGMVAFAYPVNVRFVDTDLHSQSAENDRMWIWNGTSYDLFEKRMTRAGVQWPVAITNLTLRAGQSFWYQRGDRGIFNWEQVVPYNIDL